MASRRAVTAVVLLQLLALAVSAQSSTEFGRAASGEMVMRPKGSAPFSGSLELSTTSGSNVFGRGALGYGLTAGGVLLQDRLWFFGTAFRQEAPMRFDQLELPENATSSALNARVDAQLAPSHDFSAFFEAARRPQLSTTTPSPFTSIAPSSFLSLRYDGIVSDNAFFSARLTRSSRTAPGIGLTPAQ